jgi:transcriptional regulator with GAF, ATPase, and Fis domain
LEKYKFKNIIGVSHHIKELIKEIDVIIKKITHKYKKKALGNVNILILGFRGTGKELGAKEIYDRICDMKNSVNSADWETHDNISPNQ